MLALDLTGTTVAKANPGSTVTNARQRAFNSFEPPHVTIYLKMQKWRLSLRSGEFLDAGAKWSLIDERVRKQIVGNWKKLIV